MERSSSPPMPSASAVSSTARAIAAAPRAPVLDGQRQLGADGAHHDLRLGVLQHRPREAPIQPVRARACPGRATMTVPAKVPPWKCGTSPRAARSSVDLPEPDSPVSTQNSPGSIARLTSLSASRSRAGVAIGDVLEAEDAHGSIPLRSANGARATTGSARASSERSRVSGAIETSG